MSVRAPSQSSVESAQSTRKLAPPWNTTKQSRGGRHSEFGCMTGDESNGRELRRPSLYTDADEPYPPPGMAGMQARLPLSSDNAR